MIVASQPHRPHNQRSNRQLSLHLRPFPRIRTHLPALNTVCAVRRQAPTDGVRMETNPIRTVPHRNLKRDCELTRSVSNTGGRGLTRQRRGEDAARCMQSTRPNYTHHEPAPNGSNVCSSTASLASPNHKWVPPKASPHHM